MSDFQVKIDFNRIPQLRTLSRDDANDAIAALAHEGRNRVVLSLQERSPGETQTRYNPRRVVVAAAPGETPNTDTGNLVNSIQVEPAGEYQYRINVGAEYGLYLELGTASMAARPFMLPMMDALQRDVEDFFRAFLGGA